jgi:hypothetical protein
MLAPLALLLALPLVTARSPQVNDTASPPPTFFPHGTAQGTWSEGTFMEDGALFALLSDAAGNPVFALEAHLGSAGQIYGELHSVIAAAAPSLAPLKVAGQAQLPLGDGSRFKAKIFSPLEGPLPIQPHGEIDGVLLLDLRRSAVVPGIQLASAPAAGLESGFALRPSVIVCPAGRAGGQRASGGAGQVPPAVGHAIRPVVVGPPQVPGVSLAGHTLLGGVHGLAATFPAVPELPAEGKGTLRARWYLLP